MITANKPLTARKVGEVLGADSSSLKEGVYTMRWGFFYTHGRTVEQYVAKVLANYPHAQVVDQGELWKPFRGGASIAAQSHWFVKFRLPTK